MQVRAEWRQDVQIPRGVSGREEESRNLGGENQGSRECGEEKGGRPADASTHLCKQAREEKEHLG